MNLDHFFRAIPKAELHVHMTGAVEPETLIALCRKNGTKLPQGDLRHTLYQRGSGPDIEPILPTLKIICRAMVDGQDFHRVAYDIQRSAASAGVRYREIFWNPTDHAAICGVSYETALDGLVAGLEDAEQDFGIIGRLIPSIDREATPEAGLEMVGWAVSRPHETVIGIGMDYMEVGNPPEKFWKAYRLAGQAGLRRTAHAGEFLEPARNVETCLDLLGCERIDHGYTIVDKPDLAQRCRDEGTVFTVVPTNSTYLKVLAGKDFSKVHPLRKMSELGLRIMPNSDDPPLHHTDPANCYTLMIEQFGFSLDELRQQIAVGIDAAWISDDLKRAWTREWLAEFDHHRAALENSQSGDVPSTGTT